MVNALADILLRTASVSLNGCMLRNAMNRQVFVCSGHGALLSALFIVVTCRVNHLRAINIRIGRPSGSKGVIYEKHHESINASAIGQYEMLLKFQTLLEKVEYLVAKLCWAVSHESTQDAKALLGNSIPSQDDVTKLYYIVG